MNTALSPEMQRCLDFVRRHGDQIYRHPGAFWAQKEWQPYTGEHFGTPTVEALVKRQYLAYDLWQAGRYGKFPIKATLTEKGYP